MLVADQPPVRVLAGAQAAPHAPAQRRARRLVELEHRAALGRVEGQRVVRLGDVVHREVAGGVERHRLLHRRAVVDPARGHRRRIGLAGHGRRRTRSSCSPRTRSRRIGSTSCPTSPAIRCRRCTRARWRPPGPRTSAPSSRWRSSSRRSAPSPRSRSPRPCARPTSSGARRRCTARGAWRPSSIRRRASTTSTRASRPPARTSPTPRSRRPTRTRRPASAS